MFSKNPHLIPQVSSSLHPDMFYSHYLSSNAPAIGVSSLVNHDNGGLNGEPSAMANTFQKKQQTVKKDRHSKIYTSQGPRDRRVRLSIGIARKFFDLQEMLGFDKPSKTLDWLLTKSKAAIKELVQSKQNAAKSSSSLNVEPIENGDCLGEDLKRKDKGANIAKESRAKARARARERTREKMCIKQMNGAKNITCSDLNNQLEFFQLSAAGSNSSCLKTNAEFHCPPSNQDLIQEPTLIKRKLKNPSYFGFQQNLIVSKDLSSNYIIPSANNATENWDFCSFNTSVSDQHKFINRNSNIKERSFWNPQDE